MDQRRSRAIRLDLADWRNLPPVRRLCTARPIRFRLARHIEPPCAWVRPNCPRRWCRHLGRRRTRGRRPANQSAKDSNHRYSAHRPLAVHRPVCRAASVGARCAWPGTRVARTSGTQGWWGGRCSWATGSVRWCRRPAGLRCVARGKCHQARGGMSGFHTGHGWSNLEPGCVLGAQSTVVSGTEVQWLQRF